MTSYYYPFYFSRQPLLRHVFVFLLQKAIYNSKLQFVEEIMVNVESQTTILLKHLAGIVFVFKMSSAIFMIV